MDRIAIIGWGSLVWAPGDLAIEYPFQPTDLSLNLEFARRASDGRLTLVLDPEIGVPCQVHATRYDGENLNEAIRSLRLRERVRTKEWIGYVNLKAGTRRAEAFDFDPASVLAIEDWGRRHNWDAVIWTALRSNFPAPFTPDAAIRHLEALWPHELHKALDYVRNTPPQVKTPVRTAVEARFMSHKPPPSRDFAATQRVRLLDYGPRAPRKAASDQVRWSGALKWVIALTAAAGFAWLRFLLSHS